MISLIAMAIPYVGAFVGAIMIFMVLARMTAAYVRPVLR